MYDTNPAQITSTDALRLQVTGLVLGGALLALVSFGAASVLFSRHLQPSAPDQPVLAALGLRRIERFAPLALEAAIAATVATAIAVVVAVALSPLLPFGVGRVAEPDPGLAVDSTALVLGGGLLALLLAVVLALVAYRSIVRPAHGRSATTSLTLAGRLRLQPVPATGTRFALEGRSEGWRAPVILTVGAAAVATALVTMSLLLSSSIGHALTTPSAAGSPWDGFATNSGPPEQIDLVHARQLADDDRVTATARVGQGPLGLAMGTGGDTISAIGIEPVRGRIEPIVLSGKAPSGPDEVLVGPAVQDTFHLDVGDQLVVTGPDGPRPLRVVGVGLLPIINEEANGWAVVLPLQTLVDLGGFEDFGQSESGVAYRVADRGDLAEVNRAAQELVGDGTIALTARIPGSVSSLREVAELPYVLAGLIGALGVLTIGFGLLLTVRHRRHELGVLRALGFRPGDARRAVHWQGVLTAAAGLVVGVPLGIVLGRQLWAMIASSVGVAPVPRLSAGTLVVVAAVVLVLGLVLSLGPAWRAGRFHPARTLRSE